MNGDLIDGEPPRRSRLNGFPVSLRRYGVAGTLEHYADRLYEAWCDRRLGIDTRVDGEAGESGLAEGGGECTVFASTSYRCLDRIFNYLQPRSHDVFLDYGCGMGRVLVQAALRPLRMVIGVEVAPALALQAKRNIERASEHLQCRIVYVHTGDAAEYEVPQSVSIVFLCNPFRGKTLSAAMQRIFEASTASGLRVRIVYFYPSRGANPLDVLPWLRRVADLGVPKPQSGASLIVYETLTGHRRRG